ncbi:MAG: phosphate signaling complex protein PhoU [Alphaproteobacteria bacterium]|jgi:phosphate transport system protein|nr:phosphate signaling complex protein PhoU [Alphaproteobacteria bacterium]
MTGEHIVRSYDTDIDELVNTISEMGGLAESQVAGALAALTRRDVEAAERVITADARLDEIEEKVDQMSIHLFARRQPMARDLRLIAMSLKISNDLERVGDYAASVAKRAKRLDPGLQLNAIGSLGRMGALVQDMLTDVLDAYIERDDRQAMSVWHRDAEVDDFYDSLFRELITYVLEDPRTTSACIDLLFIAKNLERIGDHATNIAERVHYILHGDRINRVRSEPA